MTSFSRYSETILILKVCVSLGRKSGYLKWQKSAKDTRFREEYAVCDNKELAIPAVTQLSYVMPGYRKL